MEQVIHLKTILTVATTAIVMMTSFIFADTLNISQTNDIQTTSFVVRIQGNSSSPYKYSIFPPSTFITDLRHLGANLNHSYVKSIDIGTEFGSPFFEAEYCSVWFNSYLVVNGQKETILGGN